MKKVLILLALCVLPTLAYAVEPPAPVLGVFNAVKGQVGLAWQQDCGVSILNFNLKAAYPVSLGAINFDVFGKATAWNGGGLQGAYGSLGLSTQFDANGKIYAQHNEGRDFFRGELDSSNEVGITYDF